MLTFGLHFHDFSLFHQILRGLLDPQLVTVEAMQTH